MGYIVAKWHAQARLNVTTLDLICAINLKGGTKGDLVGTKRPAPSTAASHDTHMTCINVLGRRAWRMAKVGYPNSCHCGALRPALCGRHCAAQAGAHLRAARGGRGGGALLRGEPGAHRRRAPGRQRHA